MVFGELQHPDTERADMRAADRRPRGSNSSPAIRASVRSMKMSRGRSRPCPNVRPNSDRWRSANGTGSLVNSLPLRLLTNLDRAALAAYCGAYALWAEATEAIQKYGAMIKAPSGVPGAVALPRQRQPAGRDHDADRALNLDSRPPAVAGSPLRPKLNQLCLIFRTIQSIDPRTDPRVDASPTVIHRRRYEPDAQRLFRRW